MARMKIIAVKYGAGCRAYPVDMASNSSQNPSNDHSANAFAQGLGK